MVAVVEAMKMTLKIGLVLVLALWVVELVRLELMRVVEVAAVRWWWLWRWCRWGLGVAGWRRSCAINLV